MTLYLQRIGLLAIMLMGAIFSATAHDFEVNGICYAKTAPPTIPRLKLRGEANTFLLAVRITMITQETLSYQVRWNMMA